MTTLVTYDDENSRKEDLLDIITNISPTKTPMLSGFAHVKAKGTLHEWLEDTLDARGHNAKVEGSDASFGALTNPTRPVNVVQILDKTFQVSDTMRRVDTAGYKDRFNYEAQKALKALSNDINHAIDRGSRATGNVTVARQMAGVINYITTNATNISGTSLTEAIYTNILQDIWTAGGDPDETYVGARVKRQINAFTANATKNVNINDRRLVNSVDIYESSFGLQKIFLDRDALEGGSSINSLVALQNDKFRIAWLAKPELVNIAKLGRSSRAMIEGEVTLEVLAEKASGKLTNIIG